LLRGVTVYLDQNVWVNLLKESTGAAPSTGTRIGILSSYKKDHAVRFPLSAMHYMETWHRSKWESRYALASTMRDLSEYLALAPAYRLQRPEIERAIIEKMDIRGYAPNPAAGAFGHGVDHAFASSSGRFRYVESLGDEHLFSPTLKLTDDPIRILKSKGDPIYQWISLAGPPGAFDIEGFDRITQHRQGAFYAASQQEKMERWVSNGGKDMVDRAVITDAFVDLLDDLNDMCATRGVDPISVAHSREDIMHLWAAIPTVHVHSSLRIQRFRNSQQKWSQHDLADLSALSVAIPYCDIVVTERQWCALAKRAKLDATYKTFVTPSIDAAIAELEKRNIEQ
jgi:hypothetical protein